MSDLEGTPPVNILLVDDDPANLLALEAILGGLDARLWKARSGEDALRALLRDEFAAVLLDVRLPGMSGYETAKHIRENPRSKSTPIIFITAHDGDPTFSVRAAYALGAVDYLVKPLIPEILRTKATVFIELFRRTQTAARAEARAEERLANVLSTVNDVFLIFDRDLRYTYVNDRMVRSSGIPRERLVGRTLLEVFPDVQGSLLEQELRRAIDEQMPVDFEFYHASSDRWFHHRGYPSRDGLMVVATEITDAKKAEQAIRGQAEKLKESEGRLRLAQLSANVGTWDWNLKSGELSWSEGLFALLGLKPAEVTPRVSEWPDYIHPDDRDETLRSSDEAIKTAGDFYAEFRVRRRDGSYRWISSRGSVHLADDGTPARFIGVNSDIHDRKLAELRQALLAEAGRILGSSLEYEVTLSQVSELVVPQFSDWCGLDLLGDDGQVRRLAVVHRDPAKVELANEYRRRYPPQPDDKAGLMAVLRTGKPTLHREITDDQLVRGARDAKHLELLRALCLKSFIIVPMTARGRTLGAWTLAIAESSRFFGEDDLQLAEELASRAALAVDNAKLFDELKQNSRRKDEFLAMLAHELRNPLSAIGSGAMLLQRPEIGAEDREWATQVISRQVTHLSRLMDDLLDVSRVSRGKTDLKKQRIDPASVVRQAIQTTQAVVSERKHKLNVSFESADLELEADPTRLEQIIVNLLENAAKYTDSGGSIWLSTKRDLDHIAISVRDNGIGIPPEQLPQIFELFAQGNPSLARSEGGLGIGLTLVKSLAELHGGSLVAKSEGPGKGSEFIVRLPAARSQESSAERPAIGCAPGSIGGRKILVIDDNIDTARGMARLLGLNGHELQTAHSGPEGIAAARAFHPDVILLDIGLPGMDGYEVARRLKEERELADVLIIAVTGYGQDEDRKRSSSAGIDYHLVKPIDHEVLVTLLAERQ